MGWCPSPEPSSPYPSESPERSSPNWAATERDAPFPEPSICLLQYSVNGLHRFPNGPLQQEVPVSRIFFYTFPSKSPVNGPPPPRSPSGSLWREKFHLQSQWLIHSFISGPAPNKEPSHEKQGKYLVTVHGAPRGQTAYMQWGAALFPKGIV